MKTEFGTGDTRKATHGFNVYFGNVMVQIHVNDGDEEKGEKIMHLIAHAPATLDALKDVRQLVATKTTFRGGVMVPTACPINNTLNEADAVIANSEGR